MKKLTKIVASIGPASCDRIEELVEHGMDVCRLNFSHDAHEFHGQNIDKIRAVSKKIGKPIAIMADMQGPKHRIGDFVGGADGKKYKLVPGQKFILDLDPKLGDETRVQLPDPDVMEALVPGTRVLLNDGKMELLVTKKMDKSVETTVVRGDDIWDRRAFNIPNAEINTSVLTEKDKKDLVYALSKNVDLIAVSFVQKASDIAEVREFIKQHTDRPVLIIAKLERPQAVERLESIIDACDGAMVARGDLGVEIPYEQVPVVQRQMIRMCRQKNKPIIVATQMMEGMTHALYPTRAEVSDVATASYQKTDATMLSMETTMGDYPIETVDAMARILASAEWDQIENSCESESGVPDISDESSLSESIAYMAELNDAKAIVVFSDSGKSARELSARRSMIPIIAVCDEEIIANQLCLSHAVIPVFDASVIKGQKYESVASDIAQKLGVVKSGDHIVVVTRGGLREGFERETRITCVIKIG